MSTAGKRLILNGFAMTVVGHVSAGLRRHPGDRADAYSRLPRRTGLAGLPESAAGNPGYAVSTGTFEDFITYVTPGLRHRGRARESHPPGVSREKLRGPGRRRPGDDHPGAAFRRPGVPA
ncbi:hypothetical protein GCM10010517_63670 [Streptosporangium fragile]|uniref:Uncharacterized protein n=1 Tax=Streptosporangium fragile TaxID=46186 RepID=A0ABP6IP41_9ACTN